MLTLVRDDSAGKSWDRFVEQHPAATVAHLSAWGRIAAGAYGHASAYLSVEDDGEKLGVLPLVLVSSRLFGRRLVSMPFLDYGGLLVSREAPFGAVDQALVDAALGVAGERGAQSLGLRQFHSLPVPYQTATDRVTMLLTLTTKDAVWKALSSERRNRIRKGEKNGLTAAWCGAEALDDLDLGRSFKSAGTHEFTRQWGAVDHTLPWIFIDTVPGAAPSVDRDARRFAPMIAAWKRLPVPVANLVGPWIRGQVSRDAWRGPRPRPRRRGRRRRD